MFLYTKDRSVAWMTEDALRSKCIGELPSVKLETAQIGTTDTTIFEPRCEKTGFLHMRKQRRRSAVR